MDIYLHKWLPLLELPPEGEVLRAWARSQGVPAPAIRVTGRVANTADAWRLTEMAWRELLGRALYSVRPS